jgi:phage-related minor tail protein
MDDDVEELVIQVRANTQQFQADIETMRGSFDASLVDGFAQAGNVLERGLLSAIRHGSLGFDDLKSAALRTMNEIAAQAVQNGLGQLFGGNSGSGGLGGLFGSLVNSLFGLPGRATGGPVSPGSAYLVGERGPEVFVPTSAGRVENGTAARPRDVRVAIQLAAPRGTETPIALQRSARQVASSVRRALAG